MRWRCSPFSGGGRCDRAAGARRLRVGAAVPQSGADGENGGSLDVLSSGRPTLGVGFSRLRKEFASLNGPAFNARGAVIEKWIVIFKHRLWSRVPVSFYVRFYRYTDIRCSAANPSRCRSRIRRSGLAGILAPPCDALPGIATAGTRSSPSPPRRCHRKRCARIRKR